MRLWHQDLIKHLPRQQLLGQHRECCALRGNGWGKKHATVNYVFAYSMSKLYEYHCLIMKEMENRGYRVEPLWKSPTYRGKKCKSLTSIRYIANKGKVYAEHNDEYMKECLDNLNSKNIKITL